MTHAGPDLNKKFRTSNAMPNQPGDIRGNQQQSKLEEFLLAHNQGEKFILAVGNANEASQIILDTGKPVMVVGGFMGFEKILDAHNLEQLVKSGQVRYFLVGHQLSMSQPELNQWIKAHGRAVEPELWQEASAAPDGSQSPAMGRFAQQDQLYELQP